MKDGNQFRVVERFTSINGEGRRAHGPAKLRNRLGSEISQPRQQ